MSENIVIIDYGSGNLHSAQKTFAYVIEQKGFDAKAVISARAEDILSADRVVLPGQGAFADCMAGLEAIPGMHDALEERVIKGAIPFFGICVGMQLMASRGLEHGEHGGLGWIPGDVVPLKPSDPTLKIPHMGWNNVMSESDHFMLQGITEKSRQNPTHFYFVHSFMVQCKDPSHMLAYTDYGGKVTALIGRDNLIGAQCHVENSQQDGLDLIERFLRWTP